MIVVTNSLTRKKEPFTSLSEKKVHLYVCGITPYDYAHVGHGRCYVTFDVLLSFLRLHGYDVRYCRNFTDIDDKLLHRAHKELGDKFRYPEVAQKYIDAYHQDMAALQCLAPDIEPRVTESIPSIIAFIEGLIAKGYAYAVDGDVYYRVRKFEQYGRLSNRTLDDLESGARVEINEKKEDPLDFALWKNEEPGTFWQSPWGYGRPGWHIECSAMARDHLADHIDIHGGGMDLLFPHHENEIAQSEGLLGGTFSKFWMHNAFVRINQEKMSKSLNNFFTLRDVFAQYDPMVVRFYYLQHHYRSPLDFSFEGLQSAEKAYRKLCKQYGENTVVISSGDASSLKKIESNQLYQSLAAFVADDLNTVGAIGVLFESRSLDDESVAAGRFFLQHALGLSLEPLSEKSVELTPEIQALLDQREVARAEKNWAAADALRDQLLALGFEVQDKKKN